MRLYNYTLFFIIIFGAVVFISDRKSYLNDMAVNRQILFENACSDGVKAAAGEMSHGQADSSSIESAYFKAMAARLGIEMQPLYRDKLEWYVPLICILYEDNYELIYSSFDDEGKYYRRSHGRTSYGRSESGAPLSLIPENADLCIRQVEAEVNKIISGWLFPDGNNIVCFDLPESTSNAFVRSITGPSVLAVSADAAFGNAERQYSVYAAEICNTGKLVVIENNGRKELHYSDCERIKSHSIISVSDYKEAAILGAVPAPCCDPLGAYCFDFCGYR